jgi:hypothetical protein
MPLRLANWIDHAGMAIVAAALSGMVIAVSAGSPEATPPRAGHVTVTSEPAGASVSMDGIVRGTTPFSGMFAAGSYEVEVEMGARRRRHRLTVTSGAEAVVHLVWPEALAAVQGPAPATPGRASPARARRHAGDAQDNAGENGPNAQRLPLRLVRRH